jgi:hypothetical protein
VRRGSVSPIREFIRAPTHTASHALACRPVEAWITKLFQQTEGPNDAPGLLSISKRSVPTGDESVRLPFGLERRAEVWGLCRIA